MFGRWASRQLRKEKWDLIHPWSGVSEEILRDLSGSSALKLVMRGSAHIRQQAKLLQDEEHRTGFPQERPGAWIIAREEREYNLADAIAVLSTFTFNTFVAEGVPSQKLRLILAGARLETFRAPREIVDARRKRLLLGNRLRVLNVGTFSFRKGMWDMAQIVRELSQYNFEFKFVGPIAPEALALAESLRPYATFVPPQRQIELPRFYAWGDVFVLPTIEDGFQTVLSHAAAAALPILTTPNGAGIDLVRESQSGWVLPMRVPEAFIKQLVWCDTHRPELSVMVERIYSDFQPRDWIDVAKDYEALFD